MIRNNVVTKLWLTIVGMFFIVQALLSVFLQQVYDKYVIGQERNALIQLALSVRDVLADPSNRGTNAQVAERLVQTAQQAQIKYSIPYTDNVSLAKAYDRFTSAQKNAFLKGNPVPANRSVKGTEELSVYVKLPSSTASPGMLVLSQQTSVLDQPSREMRNLILIDTIFGIILATGLAFVVSKNVSRPLIEMNRAAEEMARGRYHQRVAVVTGDEVGRLGNTFNALAEELANTVQELSIEREGLQGILSSLQDGVVATDMAGRVTLANPPALRRLRTLSVADHGVVDMQLLPERLMQLFRQVTNVQKPVFREDEWEGRTIAITMLPLYEVDSSHLRGTLSVLRDVTEERRLDRLRKDFIANVSHELRTPLSMMQGYAEALIDDISDDPGMRRELTEIIHDETLRMKRLVNDLLNLAQLESGQFQMNIEPVDLIQLVRRVGRKFQALAAEGDVQFIASATADKIPVLLDEDRMEQVFTNLLDNAFRHTERGQIVFDTHLRGDYAYIRISDTGAGIPEEDLPYIFERFYKADKARTRTRSGTGLGLAIARQIVTEHNGDILVESHVGEGTTFTVVLPIAGSGKSFDDD